MYFSALAGKFCIKNWDRFLKDTPVCRGRMTLLGKPLWAVLELRGKRKKKKKKSTCEKRQQKQWKQSKTLPSHKKRSHHHTPKVFSMQISPLSVFRKDRIVLQSSCSIQTAVSEIYENHSIGGRFCVERVYVSHYPGSSQHSVTHPADTPLTSPLASPLTSLSLCTERKITSWKTLNLYTLSNTRSFSSL